MNPATVKEWLFYGKTILKDIGIESYFIDAEILLMTALNFTKTELFTKDNYILTKDETDKYKNFLNKRKNFMPVQYIIEKCEFMGLEFRVNPSTLIPRNDTEILVEYAINYIKENNCKTVLDIGTGSGAIAVSVAYYCPDIKAVAVDISEKALNTAKENAKINNVSERIDFIKSDIFENITEKYDIIISNPPYIQSDIIKTLIPQVKDYEPLSALDGGKDGLYFYKKIISECKNYINKNGALLFEIGYNQSFEVSELLSEKGFGEIKTTKDYAGLDRVVSSVYKQI